MNAFFNIFTFQKSKPPIQNTTLKKLKRCFARFFIESHRCRIHAGFMPFSRRIHANLHIRRIYVRFMSDSCRIQLLSALSFINIALCRFHAVFMPFSGIFISTPNSCQIHAGFSRIHYFSFMCIIKPAG